MLFYQIRMVIKPYKTDEFITSMHAFARKFRKVKGCLGYSVYRDSEKDGAYCLAGAWKTSQTMEQHFRTTEFEVLIGAAKVLGKTFDMHIDEVVESGGFELAKRRFEALDEVHAKPG